jgi:fatty aldehyde-generating acyl-ACP reductase
MSTDTFAFMIHPIEPKKDVARRFPLLGRLPSAVIDYFSSFFPPVCLSHVTGIRSAATGKEIDGWLVACPMTPRRMLQVSVSTAYRKLIQTGRLAEHLGARILGLGAFTAIVGDAGVTVARELSIPVTTGNSYTVAVAVEAALEGARRLGLEPARSTAAVVGAYGSTGRACAHLLGGRVGRLILIGREQHRLEQVRSEIRQAVDAGSESSDAANEPASWAWGEGESVAGARVTISDRLDAVRQADIVLTVTSAVEPIISPEHLKPGAVVCDVSRPRNVSRCVAEQREDVLVIEGGVVDVPGEVDFGFDFGFPGGQAYACMAETMVLAMEARYESYSLGRELSLDRVAEIAGMAAKHGFRLSGLRSFEQVVSEDTLEKVRQRVYQKRLPRDHGRPARGVTRRKNPSAERKLVARDPGYLGGAAEGQEPAHEEVRTHE